MIVVTCVGLGVWQLERAEEKRVLKETVETRLGLDPIPLPRSVDKPLSWDFRPVTVTGTLRHDKESYLQAHTATGRLGFQVITPLERQVGQAVLVNRGWVPLDRKDPASRMAGQVKGEVTVTGLARVPEKTGGLAALFQVDNDLENKTFLTPSLGEMALAHEVEVVPVFVDANGDLYGGGWPRGEGPVGGQTVVEFTDNHLAYAIQWFLFAAVAAVVFVLYHRREER